MCPCWTRPTPGAPTCRNRGPLRRAGAHEAEPGILAVSVNAGFSEADITEMGPTVLVTHDEGAAEARAAEIAEGSGARIWDGRGKVSPTPS
jgi:microcystin degradation protein MlrC